MNAFEQFLASILNPGGRFSAGTQLASAGRVPTPTPALARAGVPTASDDQMLGVFPTAQAPMAAPARAPEAVSAPVAPVTPPRSGTASPRPSGGGVGDFLGNIFMPQRAQRNQTVSWLQQQGLDEGTATLLASNKSALQDYLLKRAQGADPKTALELQKLQLEVEEKRNPTTDDVREYQFARNQGYEGSFTDFMREMRQAGATNVNVGPQGVDYGTPPTGYAWQRSPDGTVALDERGAPIALPVGPALEERQAAERQAEQRSGSRTVQSDVVTTAADNARKLISGTTTGTPGRVLASVLSESDAAALRREVNVLKSATSLETLNAMRQQSPTGGALGNVTERELDLLAAAAGSLDPDAGAEEFSRALDTYERTLLRIIHGPEEGDRVFMERRNGGATSRSQQPPQPRMDGGKPVVPRIGTVEDGYRFKGGNPANPESWERVQ